MLTTCETIVHSIPDAVMLLDKDGFIQYCNPSVLDTTGYSDEELENQHLALLYGNDDIKANYELDLAFKKGKFISEGWKYNRQKEKFWGEMVLSPVLEDGKLNGFTCMLRNLDEKKKRELELREKEERYRLMVEGVRDYAIFMLDTEGYILTWNEGAKRLKGYSPDEIIGKHFSIFYTAEDLANKKTEMELKVAVETGKYEEIWWRIKKDGSLFWANVVITALFNERNQHIGFSKVTRDLTERKQYDEQMRQSEERYRALVEQVTDYGIFMLDEKGRIISWNEGAKRMKGYESSEIIGKYFSIFYPEEDIINGKPDMELRVARTTGKYEEEGWRLRKDGTRFWANVVITAVYNNNNNLIGYSKVTRDLSERKEAEKALRESYEHARSLALELRKTNDELIYANQELEQFTSIVSHDLQEPIRTIKSFLQLISMKIDDEEYEALKNYIQKSIRAADRMRELILNLLQYAQLSKGNIKMEAIPIKDLINEVLQNLRSAIENSGAEIEIDSEVEVVQGDRVQLVQLLQNLLSNALKFTNQKQPSVRIHCREIDGHTRFAVSDNGIGIEKRDLGKVFEIFRRLDTKQNYPGTGIGLAICKKIVDRHNGRIWPESEPGKGTTFYFTINEQSKDSLAVS